MSGPRFPRGGDIGMGGSPVNEVPPPPRMPAEANFFQAEPWEDWRSQGSIQGDAAPMVGSTKTGRVGCALPQPTRPGLLPLCSAPASRCVPPPFTLQACPEHLPHGGWGTQREGGCQIWPLFSGCSWFLRDQEKEGQDVALNEAGRK